MPPGCPVREVVGAWALVDFHIRFDDGRDPVQPFGPGATGLITYTEDGWMSAILSRAHRSPLDVPRLEASHRATDAEKASAFDSYLSYGGRWHVDGSTMIHTVHWGLTPNIVGLEQRRDFTLDGDRLTLAYRGGAKTYILRWKRPSAER